MTYGELIVALSRLSAEQLDADVTVYNAEADEFSPVKGPLRFAHYATEDVLDNDHPYLTV